MLVTPGSYNITNIPRSDLEQDADQLMTIAIPEWRIFDAFGSTLPNAGASDDLGVYGGTVGTNAPYIGTGDVKTTDVTRKARVLIPVRNEFVLEGAMYIRARAGMVTTVAGTSATIDFSAYKCSGAVTGGSDLVTTAAQSINSLTWADYDFAISTAGLVAGDELDILATIAITDSGSGTVTAVIGGFRAFIGCTIRG